MTARAPLERGEAGGLRPAGPGWFVVNVDEAEHLGTGGHAFTALEGDGRWEQFGFSVDVLEPGAGASYHREAHEDETFLMLDGECDVVIEGELHRIDAGTLVHCPAGTAHVFVGAGERGGRLVMLGRRGLVPDGGTWGEYLPDPAAARFGLAVDEVTSDPAIAYAGRPPVQPVPAPRPFAIDRSPRRGSTTHGDGTNHSARLETHPEHGGRFPVTPGWFLLHLDDALWVDDRRVASAWLEGRDDHQFRQYGVNVRVAQPGAPLCAYHRERHFDEVFLVLDGEGLLLVEGEEVAVRAGDICWCPRDTGHVFVGGDGPTPLVLLLVGTRDAALERSDPQSLEYPIDDLALRHGAGVRVATFDPDEAYADWPDSVPTATPPWTWRTR